MTAAVDTSRPVPVGRRPRRTAAASAPVLVIGAPFSGATALGWALGQHPGLVPVVGGSPASHLLSALRVLEEELLPLLGEGVIQPFGNAIGDARPGSMSAGRTLLDALAAEIGGAARGRWLLAGPECVPRVAVARRLFPALRLVHVHRDPAAVARHLAAAGEREGIDLTAEEAAAIAGRETGRSEEAAALLPPEHVVRVVYGRLVEEPDRTVRDCLTHLGLEPREGSAWPLRLLSPLPGEELHPRAGGVAGIRFPTPLGQAPPRPATAFERRFRRLVESVTSVGSVIVVVSRGDEGLVRFRGRSGWHFPRAESGAWAGHYPSDGAAATAHLHELAGAGASHLVVPRPAFWWLEHYPELRAHLDRHATLLACDAEIAALWRLDPTRPLVLPATLEHRRRVPVEPDNHAAFGTGVSSPPPRRRAVLPGSLWAVTTYFNPEGYATKAENYRRFRARLGEAGVALLAVEVAFGDAPFALGADDADQLLQLRGGDVLWQKERLLNLGVAALPADCDKVAWLDADVVFSRPDWASETARLLERHVVVQPFSHCVRLPRGVERCEPAALPFGPGEGELFHGIAWGVRAHGRQALTSYARHGHTGFAWAARRALLERHGLYDVNLLGNADTDIAHALFGSTDYWGLRKLGPRMRAHLRRWAAPFAAEVRGSVAHLDGVVTHLWHGSPADRLYDRPLDVLDAFDPDEHLVLDGSGLYRFGAVPEAIRTWSAAYFAARREDG